MHRSVLVASVIVLLLRPSMAIAQVQAGAVTEALRSAAERGDAQAQLDYAKALGSQHPDARAWAQHAADQGLAEAWFWLGYHAPGDEAAKLQSFRDVRDELKLRLTTVFGAR